MTKIKKGTALGYFMPGIIILCVLSFITLCLLCVPTYIYLSTLTVAGLVHYFMIKRHEHPWGLNQDQIEDSKKISVCIVGAGFSGLCMAIKLKEAGINFRVLEKNPDLGGTWWSNKYPGVACDVWSIVYQFSFYLTPNWSGWLASGAEIQAYMKEVAKYYNIENDISYGVSVEKAQWNEESKCWRIETSRGEIISVTHLVSAVGYLQKPHIPEITGQNRFSGSAFHSSHWNQEEDLAGKRVALIGTAASAVQIAPKIVDKVRSLDVFQRTPNWFIPQVQNDQPEWLKMILRLVPFSLKLMYGFTFCVAELYARIWIPKGKFAKGFQRHVLEKAIREQVGDNKVLVEKLIPKYDAGCKRIMISSDFLPMFTQKSDKAHLITDSIDQMTEDSIVAGDKRYLIDVVIYATGFEVQDSICAFEVQGANKTILSSQFDKDPTAYLGMTLPNFPNFFLLLGPNTVLAHNSAIFMIECQVNYINKCIKEMICSGIRSMEVKKRPTEKFRQMIDKLTDTTNFSGTCRNFYRNKNGTNFILWPTHTFKYWWMTRKVEILRDFKIHF